MSKELSNRRMTIKKLPVVNLLKSSTIVENDGKSVLISARKAGRQRLRQVTRLAIPSGRRGIVVVVLGKRTVIFYMYHCA